MPLVSTNPDKKHQKPQVVEGTKGSYQKIGHNRSWRAPPYSPWCPLPKKLDEHGMTVMYLVLQTPNTLHSKYPNSSRMNQRSNQISTGSRVNPHGQNVVVGKPKVRGDKSSVL